MVEDNLTTLENKVDELSENYLQLAYENVFDADTYFYKVLSEAFVEHLKRPA